MVKRRGYLLEKVADMDNLRLADKEAQAGKVRKNRHIRRHNLHAEEDLIALHDMILNLDFPDPEYKTLIIANDNGKVREIKSQKYYPWRILHHAIMNVIGKDLYHRLIDDSFACVPGKGLHFGVKRMKMMLRRYPENKWFWKADCKKFYQSIPHEEVMKALERKFKDRKFLKLIEIAILNYDSGVEMQKILSDEREKRIANWGIHQPAFSQLHSK
jgi:hypothetical protein